MSFALINSAVIAYLRFVHIRKLEVKIGEMVAIPRLDHRPPFVESVDFRFSEYKTVIRFGVIDLQRSKITPQRIEVASRGPTKPQNDKN